MDARSGYALEKLPKEEVEEVILEEIPDVTYEDIGGLGTQIEDIRDAVELPFLYAELFEEHQPEAAEGHPAVRPAGLRQDAHREGGRATRSRSRSRRRPAEPSARSYFLNIKGPELLNKYVGETERQIRLIFQRAQGEVGGGLPGHRVLRRDGLAVPHPRHRHLVATSRTRSCRSCSSEIDGVETLKNVIVIGASNREDLIDPAILRPGRLDVKIKIERPDAEAASEIFAKYLTADVPIHADEVKGDDGDARARAIRG